MALTKCHECSNVVSSTAKACPTCGAKVKRKAGLLSWLLLIFFVFPLTFWTIAAFVGETDSTATHVTPEQKAQQDSRNLDGQRESYARIIAEREIRARLKAPRGAKFSGYSDTEVGKLTGGSENEWVVKGYVDAENTFGAKLRNRYQVIIEFENGEFDSSRTKSAVLLD